MESNVTLDKMRYDEQQARLIQREEDEERYWRFAVKPSITLYAIRTPGTQVYLKRCPELKKHPYMWGMLEDATKFESMTEGELFVLEHGVENCEVVPCK